MSCASVNRASGTRQLPTPADGWRPIRRLAVADLADCIELTLDRGWLAEELKWRLMLTISEVYGVDDPAGGLAGAVGLTRYGDDLAAVGMLLVATACSRQGLGRRLMRHVLDQAAGAVVCLYATAMGLPLYQQLGFQTVEVATRYTGLVAPGAAAASPRPAGLRAVQAADISSVLAADAAAFGAPRAALLAELAGAADVFLACGDPAAAYGAVWGGDDLKVIGPVVASEAATVPGLLDALVAGRPGPVRIDVSSRHPQVASWARARGLASGVSAALMTYGGPLPGDRSRLYAPANVALG